MSDNLEQLIKRQEGTGPVKNGNFFLYRDNSSKIGFEGKSGKLTIGWGYNIDDKGLPEDIVQILLDRTIKEAKTDLLKSLPWTFDLDEVRQEVLINMVFNMGLPSFLEFKNMISSIQKGDYKDAAQHGLSSAWYKQVGNRAEYLMKVLETGEY